MESRDRPQGRIEDETEEFDKSNHNKHFVDSHMIKDSPADHLNKLRTKREIRNVSVAVTVHAGANLKMNAGSITYLIPAKTTPTPATTTVPHPDLNTSPTESDPPAAPLGASNTAVTVVASVFGVLGFIAVATALGNV